jgi:hypothetical protein
MAIAIFCHLIPSEFEGLKHNCSNVHVTLVQVH